MYFHIGSVHLKEIVDFTLVILSGRQFPDKAIDLMDEACTTVKLHKPKEVQNKETNTRNAPEEITVGPCHIAQVNY